jgi:hypothetical protein
VEIVFHVHVENFGEGAFEIAKTLGESLAASTPQFGLQEAFPAFPEGKFLLFLKIHPCPKKLRAPKAVFRRKSIACLAASTGRSS